MRWKIYTLEVPFFYSLKASEAVVSRPAPNDMKGKLWFLEGLTTVAVFSYLVFQWFMRPIYGFSDSAVITSPGLRCVGDVSGIFTIVMLAVNYRTNLKAKGFDPREESVIQSGRII